MAPIPDKYKKYVPSGFNLAFYNADHNRDRDLYEGLQEEAWDFYGVPVIYYITSFDTTYNPIFGEDSNRRFVNKFEIMSYYDLPDENHLWTKFGIEGLDNFHLYISMDHFEKQSTSAVGYSYTPKVGDIIKAFYNEYFYEIINVKREAEQFLQGKHSWDLTVKPYLNENLSVSNTLSADEINNFNANRDIFDVSATVEQLKPDVLYQPGVGEESSKDPFASWN